MTLKERITEEMKTAMRAADKERLATIRMVQAAIKQREVDERIQLDDAQVLSAIEKMIKQRRESIVQYEKGGRADLADAEKFEVGVLSGYLPQQLGEAEVAAEIDAAMAATGAKAMPDMGKVMAILKPKLAGRAELAKVSALVKSRLSS